MNIKEIWEKYKASDKRDKILDAAMADFQELTDLSVDEAIQVIDAIANRDSSKLATANKQVALFKKAADTAGQFAELLDSENVDALADFIQKIMSQGSKKEKKDLVFAYDAFDADKRVPASTKQEIADALKERKIWNSFNSHFQKNVHHIRSVNKVVDKKSISDPPKGNTSVLYDIQKFTQAKNHNAPLIAKLHLGFKIAMIIITRLSALAAIVGVAGAIYLGYDKVKSFVGDLMNGHKDEKEVSDLEPQAEEQNHSTNNKAKSNESIPKQDTMSKDGRELMDSIDEKTKGW